MALSPTNAELRNTGELVGGAGRRLRRFRHYGHQYQAKMEAGSRLDRFLYSRLRAGTASGRRARIRRTKTCCLANRARLPVISSVSSPVIVQGALAQLVGAKPSMKLAWSVAREHEGAS